MAQNKFSAGHKSILLSIFTAENLFSPVQVKFSQVSYFAELNLAWYGISHGADRILREVLLVVLDKQNSGLKEFL
jgi:hypothetical protein